MAGFSNLRVFVLLVFPLLAFLHSTGAEADTPTAPLSIAGQPVVEVATGVSHTCARIQDGRLFCWGENSMGQVGNNSTTHRSTPTLVHMRPTDTLQIVAGGDHSCALRADGTVICWGANYSGQLGDGTTTNRLAPRVVAGLANITQIAAGGAHTCALRANGRIFCWGGNYYGALGDGTNSDRTTPVALQGLWSKGGAIQIAAGGSNTCMVHQNGRVACWGSNQFGQLGDGTTINRTTPVAAESLRNITQVSTGNVHSCALRQNRRVFCWGFNDAGRLGQSSLQEFIATPLRVRNLSQVTQISAGGNHNCARRETGRVFCWGGNNSGSLGDGTTTSRFKPERVQGINNALQVAAGGSFSCGIRQDGQARCWGRNSHGQIGDGTTLDRLTPVIVAN